MRYWLTPATERVLATARQLYWPGRPGAHAEQVDILSILWGLVEETECRAAAVLAEHGIDAAAISREFGPPASRDGQTSLTPQVRAAMTEASHRLADHPQPLALATEHLLLGVLLGDSPESRWLQAHGIDGEKLLAEIHRLAGVDLTPLDVELPLPAPSMRFIPRQPPALPGVGIASAASTGDATPGTAGGCSVSVPLRVIDACGNRAREGLRVVEDYVRFVLDDAFLSSRLKQLRHNLQTALAAFPQQARLIERESQRDVGATNKLASELTRHSVDDLLAANFSRATEALRSLEEFSKLGGGTSDFERIRYELYTLEHALAGTRQGQEKLAHAKLYVLLDGCGDASRFRTLAQTLVTAGVHVLQLRDKSLDDRTLLARARELRSLTRGTPTLMIVNDRPDIAKLCDADGVHVGQEELSVHEARQIVGPNQLIGVSTHNISQVRQAVLDGASYIGCGPTFPGSTKQFAHYPGLAFLREAAAEATLPAFAIGGITAQNLPQVLATGIGRIAVARAITTARDPSAAVAGLLGML